MGTIIKSPLRLLIKMVAIHPLASLALVVLVGVGLVLVSGRSPQPFQAQADSQARSNLAASSNAPQGTLLAPAATQDFMTGQVTFNAGLVWRSLSDDLHATLAEQGGQQALQDQLDQYRQEGRAMDKFTYVGGYDTGNSSFYFYVATVHRPEAAGQEEPVFFAFTVDQGGKIVKVE